jgi:hypothetical protein
MIVLSNHRFFMSKLIIAMDIRITNENLDVYFRFNGKIHINFNFYDDLDDSDDEPGENDDPIAPDSDPDASSWPPINYN